MSKYTPRRIIGSVVRRLAQKPKQELSEAEHGRCWLPTIATEKGIGIELGVAEGYFSNIILTNSKLSLLYSVDAWGDHHDDKEYFDCIGRLTRHGERSIVLRMYFDKALSLFPDEHFDFIYVDAYAGSGQENGRLLDQWWPKLKCGGIFSGHDYHPKWQATIDAVDKFCAATDHPPKIIPGITTGHPHDQYNSWHVVKRSD